jgi:hypothetical protein
MCFEFIHSCDGELIEQINILVGEDSYFMVCIGELNYLYCNKIITDKIKGLLFMSSLVLCKIGEQELMSILDFNDTKRYQRFHGSKPLFHSFVAQHQKIK